MGINKHQYQPQVLLKCGNGANVIKWAIKGQKSALMGSIAQNEIITTFLF